MSKVSHNMRDLDIQLRTVGIGKQKTKLEMEGDWNIDKD